jgi:hypothetical protein
MDRDRRFNSSENGSAMQSYFWDRTVDMESACNLARCHFYPIRSVSYLVVVMSGKIAESLSFR